MKKEKQLTSTEIEDSRQLAGVDCLVTVSTSAYERLLHLSPINLMEREFEKKNCFNAKINHLKRIAKSSNVNRSRKKMYQKSTRIFIKMNLLKQEAIFNQVA